MLRISTFNEPDAITLKLEGKVIRDWVPEARRIWKEVENGKGLIVDLLDVSFVDDHGRGLLAEMHAEGAKLVGGGPMMSALIEEIQGEMRTAKGSRLLKMVLFLVGLLLKFAQI